MNIDGVYTKKPTILPSLELIPINLPEESTNSTNSTNVINNIDLITNPKFYDGYNGKGDSYYSWRSWGIMDVVFDEDWVVNEYNDGSGAFGRPRVNLINNNEDGLEPWNYPTGLDSEIPYFIGIQGYNSWISQIISIYTPGKYILKFLCARRTNNGEVPITIEFNNTTETHILNTHEFAELSYNYDITESGDYNLKFTNIIDASGVLAGRPSYEPGETAFIANISFYFVDFLDFNLELEGTNSSIFFPYVFNENTSPIRIKSNILDEINSNNISIELVATLVNPLSPCTIFNIIDSSQKNNFKLELEFNSENELSLLFSWIKEENNDNILTWRNSILPLNIGQQTHFVFIIDTINNDVSMICDGQNIFSIRIASIYQTIILVTNQLLYGYFLHLCIIIKIPFSICVFNICKIMSSRCTTGMITYSIYIINI